jgi:branched-chain amino acid aminotransferase
MEQAIEKYFLEGEELKPVNKFYDFPDKQGIYIFEVLRVISGVPLFIDEHLGRLQQSVLKSGLNREIDLIRIKKSVLRLIKENQTQVGNIKIVFWFHQGQFNFWLYFIPYNYPSAKDYAEGVRVGVLQAERTNPEAKTIQPNVRETANKLINQQNIYEVLLVDSQGNIREGSRSNVFFVKGDKIVTPPTETVLNGITRQKVIEIINSSGLDFEENLVPLNELGTFDCLFLTGTSPKVLPVSQVENMKFDPQNSVCRSLIIKYNSLLERYFKENR